MGVQIDKKDIMKNLPKKGFVEINNRDHSWYYFYYNGNKTIVKTKVSHTPKLKTYSGQLLGALKSQLYLDSSLDVKKLCECPMEESEYIGVLKSKSLI